MEATKNTIGRVLKMFRIANGYSLTEVAELMKVTHPYISAIEGGNKKVGHNTLQSFANAYKVGAYEIMDSVRYYEGINGDELKKYQLTFLKVLEIVTSHYRKGNDESKSIYIVLRIARNANQMTVHTASSISEVDVTHIMQLEAGKKDNITAQALEKLAKTYKLNVDQVKDLANYYDKLEIDDEDRKVRLTLIKILETIESNLAL